jgi:hypothetical protein
MRQALWCGVVLCGLAMHGAMAQQSMGTQQQSIGANQSIMTAILEPVTDAVYQAEKVLRSEQTLSDGTVITHETRGLIARDAQGRMREDINIVQSGQVDGKQQNLSLQSASVGDPVAHTILIWSGDKTKIAMQMQLPTLPKNAMTLLLTAPPSPPPPGSVAGIQTPRALHMSSSRVVDMDATKDEVRTEDLGQQSIEGILVTGKRTTTTIATGRVGNDRPIVVVHEEWRSPELKIVVKTIDTDPRTGVQTMELQGLTRTDPDAALFQVPAGYKVQDMADMLKGLSDMGKTKTQ